MSDRWINITPPAQSFAGLPVCTQLNDMEADIAIIGVHYISPYPLGSSATTAKTVAETAPDAIRTILTRGAIAVALGTDEGGAIAVMRTYDIYDGLCVVHIDAHIDW
jgi:arginase family enzyme